jgi:hypothetical protein
MKKILLIMTLAVILTTAFAQQGEIIYVENPSPNLLQPIIGPGYALYDFDANGTQDLWIGVPNYYWYCVRAFTVGDMQYYSKHMDQFVHPGDTLALIPESCWYNAPEDPWGEKTSKDGPTIIVDYGEDVDSAFIGVRRPVEGGYCYGWMRISTEVDNAAYPNNESKCYIHDYAFCTDPNYPFRAGQTSFDWGEIKETESIGFASIRPNPTNGLVTVTGDNLRQAEVLNVLGQKVLTERGEGNEFHIDMAALPAGVYFVNITDEEGRQCVRKVVKE